MNSEAPFVYMVHKDKRRKYVKFYINFAGKWRKNIEKPMYIWYNTCV